MSKLVCLMPVRNEEAFLGLTARAVLRWVDEIIILLHCCTDASPEIAISIQHDHPNRVHFLIENDPVWYEMKHRQSLLDEARHLNATHIVMVDADEILTGNLLSSIRGHVESTPPNLTMQLPWQCLRGGLDRVHADGIWGEANVCMAFVDQPKLHWTSRDGYDFHHRHPMGQSFLPYRPVDRSQGGLMHLQFASEPRLRAKQALYKITERLRWPRRSAKQIEDTYNYAIYGTQSGRVKGRVGQADEWLMTGVPWRLNLVPDSWWAPYRDLMPRHLNIDQHPWQVDECLRMLDKHGRELFSDLDLFGIETLTLTL